MLLSPGSRDDPAPPKFYKTKLGDQQVLLAVVGRHMTGESHNHELVERGARYADATTTAPCYRLYLLPPRSAPLPALVRRPSGSTIDLELWTLSAAAVGDLLVGVPAPLGFGRVHLKDGRHVLGFVAEAEAVDAALLSGTAQDITEHGGWRRRPRHPEEIS